ncbi:Aluminum-activated malate transporter 9 [Abeliophyllum distichum]|uniref:Aluminum-activated malate transporter 9 n=1 Tax=Abeliophyllum distichum TaxID=126358 RepID=A0ABD1UIV4_9LAMI
MSEKKASIEIDIPSKLQETNNKSSKPSFSCKEWILGVWKFAKEDINRVLYSLKMGFAVLLVSLLILCQAPYQVFGINIVWAILTVAIMFEYTVGATFGRGFNRAFGTLAAAILAIAIGELALSTGGIAEPIIIGVSIFIIGFVTSFIKLLPSFVPYESGFRIILFTYCLIIVFGYRMGSPFRTAMDRLYSIAIGGLIALTVNLFIFPIWAGEQLHKELVNNFNSVADALEECVKKYLEDDGSEHPEFSNTVMDEFPDEPAYKKCRSTLNSSAKLESLGNSAKWEPPHGRFQQFFYPWLEYVKVGAVLRYCAYEVMALHGILHSEIQAPYNLRITFQKEIQEATSDATELIRYLGKDICNMRRSLKTSLLKRVHSSTERLQRAIKVHSYLLTSANELHDNSSHTISSTSPDLSNQLVEPYNKCIEQSYNPPSQPNYGTTELQRGSYHEMMRKQSRSRLYSWPSREVEAFENEGGFSSNFIPRMQALQSTATLSLATFTSLLVEFVARLDRLVEAVENLSKVAKFKQEAL